MWQNSVEIEENAVLPPEDDISDHFLDLNEETEDDDPYYVTWTLYIALAFPPEEDEVCKVYKRKPHTDRGCYHIEYKLLPGDTETVKLDLLLFGPVAKLYKEEGSEILKTWTEEDQTWVGWTQDFNVKVNRAMAIHLLHHKISVHLWNNKDKLFSQSRFEKQRPLRLGQDLTNDTEMCGGVKSMVTKMRSLCQKASSSRQPLHSNSKWEIKDKNMTLPEIATHSEYNPATEVDMASVQLSPIGFLAGEQSLTKWALVGSCGVNECMIQISLERPLLSDQLKAELNPLAITILSATSMPFAPVPFHVLEEKCMPVYCQYKFHNLQMHRTNYEKHGDKICFRDVNVIFTGQLNPQDLHEFLSGPPMTIEIHDRDRKQDDKTPVGFSCSFSGISRGATLKRKKEDFNYHGVASLNFSKLLLGTTNFKVCLPIKCCTLPLDMDTPSDLSVPPGHYITANSELKVRIKLACPLNFCNNGSKIGLFEALFGRIVYIFDYNNVAVMDKLRLEILKSNAEAFEMDSHALENTENALSNYSTYFKHNQSPDLDYVTGFHLVDKRTQIVVIEGLRHKAVRRLWESVSMKLSGSKEEQVIVHYNSSLAFFKRIYDTLNLSLAPIILPMSLEIITMEPLIYVRGIIPPLCLQGLLRLKQLCQVRSLKDAVQYDLFPSAEMIQSLIQRYKIPTQQWKQFLVKGEQTLIPVKSQSTTDTKEYSYCHTSKDYGTSRKAKDYLQENIMKVHENSARIQRPVNTIRLKTSDYRPAHNYSIQTFNTNELNKEWLQRQMAKLPGRRFTYSQEYCSATVEPGNYTVTPTKNSPPGPSEVFTLEDQGQAPVFEVKVTSTKYGNRYAASDKTWDISLSRPKAHPQTPDQARVEELRKPWRENVLHGNILKPPLSRDPWSWNQRSQDFQLYYKAMPFFITSSVSDRLAGESLQKEQTSTLAAKAQHRQCEKKLLFAESSTGSVPEFRFHVANTDRFHNILKEEPQKNSLRKPGILSKPVPHLPVISHSGDVTDVQRSSALALGPRLDCSLNSIPRHSTEIHKNHCMQV